MIEIKNLTKKFGPVTAVSDINLTVSRGEFFGFLGPNGAGKTTTIRILSGLARPTSGRAAICGVDVVKSPVRAKAVTGLIPDRPFLYEKLSGREYLSFIGDTYGLDHRKCRKKIDELLQLFYLEQWGDELIESYSHGMKQKIVFAGAFLHEPEVLLVDEPMVGLDPRSMELVKGLLKEKCSRGVTVFMSTHSLEVVEEICTTIGIINRGKLIAWGTMEEVRRQARSKKPALLDIFLKLTEEETSALRP